MDVPGTPLPRTHPLHAPRPLAAGPHSCPLPTPGVRGPAGRGTQGLWGDQAGCRKWERQALEERRSPQPRRNQRCWNGPLAAATALHGPRPRPLPVGWALGEGGLEAVARETAGLSQSAGATRHGRGVLSARRCCPLVANAGADRPALDRVSPAFSVGAAPAGLTSGGLSD